MRSEVERLINIIREMREALRDAECRAVLAEIETMNNIPAIRPLVTSRPLLGRLYRAVLTDDDAELLTTQQGGDVCTTWAVVYMLRRLPPNSTEEDVHIQLRRLELSARVIAERILRGEGVIGDPSDEDAE